MRTKPSLTYLLLKQSGSHKFALKYDDSNAQTLRTANIYKINTRVWRQQNDEHNILTRKHIYIISLYNARTTYCTGEIKMHRKTFLMYAQTPLRSHAARTFHCAHKLAN